ncbi:MAG TPA: Ig-like domain-containing protein, partial [Mycobacteriales bacterium]|nr:Ig-like domain-containing protein [Mycobacteriales bacterium]
PTGTTSDYACTANPEIYWQPVAGITEYAVTIADDASFTNIEHVYTTPFLSLTPRDELADYTAGAGYHIAVQPCVTASDCGAATVVTATKRTPAPNGLTTTKVQGGFQLSWNNLANRFGTAVGDPAVGPQDYQVEVAAATDTDFDNPVITENVDAACDASSETCYAAPSTTSPGVDEAFVSPSASGDYVWRVAAVDETGNVLAASNTSSQFTIDNTPPVLTISTKSGVGVEGPLTISSTEALSGASSSTVHVVLAGTSTPVAGTLTSSSAKTWQFTPNSPLVVGGTYKLKLDPTVTDAAGNSGVVGGNGVRVTTKAPDTSKAWGFTGTWKAKSASGALSGSYKQSSKGHKATVEVVGTKATLYACKSPSFGSVTVTVGGHSKTVSEHQSYTRCGVAVWSKTLAKGKQTIVVKVAKGKGNIDELTVS